MVPHTGGERVGHPCYGPVAPVLHIQQYYACNGGPAGMGHQFRSRARGWRFTHTYVHTETETWVIFEMKQECQLYCVQGKLI